MKQFFLFLIQNGRLQKTEILNSPNSQFCEGHWCGSTYTAERLTNVSLKTSTTRTNNRRLIQVLTKKRNFRQYSINAKTIFAPNDAAFTKLTDFEKLTNPEKLTTIKNWISNFCIYLYSWVLNLSTNQS